MPRIPRRGVLGISYILFLILIAQKDESKKLAYADFGANFLLSVR